MTGRRTAVLFSLLVALAVPASASAHATLVRATPANGDVVASAPAVVRLEFDDAVQPLGGSEAIRNGGRSVLGGEPTLAPGNRHVVLVPLRANLPNGDYTVLWRVLSDDGHTIVGVLAFGVGSGRPPPVAALSAPAQRPSARSVVSRFVFFAGLLAAAGTALFGFVAGGVLGRAGEAGARRVSVLVCLGCVLVVAGGSALQHGSSWQTRFGASLNAGLILALIGGTLAAIGLVERRARTPAWLLAVALVPVPSVGGHALDPGRPWPNVVADALHVLAASTWVGALLGLALVVPVAAREAELERGRVWAEAGARASTLALAAVATLAVTGVFRALWELTAVGQLVSTGYGRALLVKTGLLVALASIGWVNRSRLVPLLSGDGLLVGRLRRNAGVEVGLVVILVGAVAVLTQSRPGRGREAAAAAGPAAPQVLPAPPRGAVVLAGRTGTRAVGLAVQPKRLSVTVLRPDGGGATGLDVRIDGRAAAACGAGCYEVAGPPSRATVVVELGAARMTFAIPRAAPDATPLLRRSSRAFRRQRSVVYREVLSSGAGRSLDTLWQVAAPDRLRYDIAGGASAVVIGGRRWDRRAGGRWQEAATPRLDLPVPVWISAARVRDAHVLGHSRRTLRVSFVDPTLPAWFDVVLDRRTLLPRTLRMTAASHFMRHRYLEYGKPLAIRPPTREP